MSSSSKTNPSPGTTVPPHSGKEDHPRADSGQPNTPGVGINVTIPYSPSDVPEFTATPLLTLNVEDVPQSIIRTPFIPRTVRLRNYYQNDKVLGARREYLLKVAQELIQRDDRLPSAALPLEAEQMAQEVLTKLDGVLVGIPYVTEDMPEIGYHLDAPTFNNFDHILEQLAQRARGKLNGPLYIPAWGLDNYPLDVWSAGEFEYLAVLYRDEVETFLAYLYHNDVLFPPRVPKGKNKVESASQLEESVPRVQQTRPEIFYRQPSILPSHDQLPKASPRLGNHQTKGFGDARRIQARRQTEPRISESTYGAAPPKQISTSRQFSELFQELEFFSQSSAPRVAFVPRKSFKNPDDSSDSDSTPSKFPRFPSNPPNNPFNSQGRRGDNPGGGDNSDPQEPPRRGGIRGRGRSWAYGRSSRPLAITEGMLSQREAQFDFKLKPDVVPKWDGDPDTLALWIIKINNLLERSPRIYDQLGEIVPTRLEKEADNWFWSLPTEYRRAVSRNWGTLRAEIASY